MILAEIYPKNDTSAFYTFAETFINILNANGTNINNRFSLLQTQFIRDTLSDYLINNNIVKTLFSLMKFIIFCIILKFD